MSDDKGATLTLLDLGVANSMIADLDDADGQMYPPERVAQQFRYALIELDRALARVAELEATAAQEFMAGYDAGWDSTGEGHNSEYTSKRYTPEHYRAQRSAALAEHIAAGTPAGTPQPRRQ